MAAGDRARRHDHRRARRRPHQEGSAARPARPRRDGAEPPGQGGPRPGRDPQPGRDSLGSLRSKHGLDPRPPPVRPRSQQPLSRGDRRARAAAARAPRPGLPRGDGRDLRPAPPGLGYHEHPHPAAVGHRLGRHGGVVREHRPPRRRRGGRGQRALRRSACATSPPAAAPRSYAGRARVGHPGRRRTGCSTPTRSPKIIAAVHAETSTGVRSDIAELGAGKGDALLVADAVTSIGGIELRADDWGIDVGYAGTQKCLGVAPGLAPFTINDRAFERGSRSRSRGTSTSACSAGTSARPAAKGGGRTYHHTAPDRDGREPARRPGRGSSTRGSRAVWARHAEAGRAPAGGARGDGPRAVRGGGLPAPGADHGEGARRRRLGRRTRATCSSGTASRSAPAPASTPPRCGGSA